MAATALRTNPRRTLRSLSTAAAATATLSPDPSPPTAAVKVASIAHIKTSIRNESNPDRLADLFSTAATSRTFYGDRVIYKRAIKKLADARRPDLIERLLEHQISDLSTPKSEGFLMRMISLYGEASMPDQAAAVFHRIPPPRTDRALCALLNAFFMSGQRVRLHDTFENAESTLGVSPGIACSNLILKSLCENGEVSAARVMLDEMPQRGLTPDIISYNTVLNGYLKSKDGEGFEELLKEMSKKKLEADVVTYNCRMSVICEGGRSFEAEELLDVMISKGVRPNAASFNTLIDGFCKEGNSSSAVKVFRRMEKMKSDDSSAASANHTTYMLLLSFLVKKEEFDTALEIVELCFGRKWAAPFSSVKGLVQGLIKNSKVKEAKDVVKKMGRVVKGDSIAAWKKIESEFTF